MRLNDTTPRLVGLVLILATVLAFTVGMPRHATAAHSSPQVIENAFQRGLRALEGGDAAGAIRIFLAILGDQPDLPRVRLELARAYFYAREWERSRREFFAVLSGDVPDAVRSNIMKFLRAIDARRGFDWNLSMGFSASPQASRNYDTDKITVNVLGTPLPFEFERDNDGEYGVTISGNAEYRFGLRALSGEQLRVTALAEGFFDIFEGNGSSADDRVFGGGLGLRGAWPQTTLTGKALIATRDFGGRHYQDRYELQGAVEWRNPTGLALFATGAAGRVDDFVSEDRDGRALRLRAGLAHSLGGRSIVGFALIGEDYDADARFESYRTFGTEIFGSTDLGHGIEATARAYYLDQDYDTNDPLLFKTRKEHEIGFDVELSKADIFLFGQFTPFVSVGISRRNSSIDAFSYYEHRFSIGVKKTL